MYGVNDPKDWGKYWGKRCFPYWDSVTDKGFTNAEIEEALSRPHKPFIPPYGPQKEWTEDELREHLAARQRKGGWS